MKKKAAEILDTLNDQRDQIADRIIEIKPRNEEERKKCRLLMQQRDRITGAINGVLAAEIRESTKGLGEKVADLKKKTEELTKVGKTLDDVDACVKVVDEVIQAVGLILSIAA